MGSWRNKQLLNFHWHLGIVENKELYPQEEPDVTSTLEKDTSPQIPILLLLDLIRAAEDGGEDTSVGPSSSFPGSQCPI